MRPKVDKNETLRGVILTGFSLYTRARVKALKKK